VIILLALILFTFIITTNISRPEDNDKNPNNLKTAQAREKPMIIWFHSAYGNSLESLKTALSSGMISHVIVLYMHRKDRDWKANQKVRKAVEMVKNSDAKLIWCRDLWPYYAINDTKYEDLFNPLYYIQEIRHLRAEAKEMGADFVGLDTEPYGNSPMKLYLKGKDRIRLNYGKRQQIKLAIEKVVQEAGKIDFILPAGSGSTDHPHNIIANLGKIRIAESTYHANEEYIKKLQYPYEIFGVYLNTVKRNEQNPKAPFVLVREIFDERPYLWSNKKGLFLYTDRNRCLAVAKDLVAYAKTLPYKNSTKAKDSKSD